MALAVPIMGTSEIRCESCDRVSNCTCILPCDDNLLAEAEKIRTALITSCQDTSHNASEVCHIVHATSRVDFLLWHMPS